eukprot:Cvel_22542.t1-p1 / transcript=Cvel_22542.t1 / gene=Cvel_22542 / organism=Chromera_velia_CCMP2878 / gene_product=Sushi, von Willebrand factor type A, EGF and, putative / transcript_product=Sushi, von Willebrand factor type A, EGF and, putative / location=Cvel_scaffold2225:14756-18510(+) / protein_length=607 / sequence_SO=supercontig / SO=protein_coding / is_pseudo=false
MGTCNAYNNDARTTTLTYTDPGPLTGNQVYPGKKYAITVDACAPTSFNPALSVADTTSTACVKSAAAASCTLGTEYFVGEAGHNYDVRVAAQSATQGPYDITIDATCTCPNITSPKREYTLVGEICMLDECSTGIHTCSRRLNYTSGIANDYINQANCTDTDGSFSCECLPGYLDRGQSLGTIPAGVYCESAKCADPQPTAPQNGHMTYSDQLWTVGIGAEVTYGCNDGYALNLNGGANETVTCYGGGTTAAPTADWPSYWSGITCDPVACTGTPPTSPGNGSLIISSGRLNFGSHGTFEKGSRFWGTDNMGTVTLGRATVIGPGATMTFQTAVSHPTDIKFGGATVTNVGTVNTSDTVSGITSVTGAGVVTSMEVIASEVIVTALTLGDGNTVTIDGNDDLTPTPTWNPGITIEYRCDDGMRRSGDASMTCQGVNSSTPTALWSNATTPTCERVVCGGVQPAAPDRGYMTPANASVIGDGSWKTFDSVSFSCQTGLILEGPATLQCVPLSGNPLANWQTNGSLTCRDPNPPELTLCPNDINMTTDNRSNTAFVETYSPWPVYTDDIALRDPAQAESGAGPALTWNFEPPYKFPFGDNIVTATVWDW